MPALPWLGRGSRGGDAGGRRGCSAGVGDASVKRLPMGTRRRVRSKGRRFSVAGLAAGVGEGDVDGQGDGRDGGRRGGRGGVQGQTVELDDTRRSVPAVAAGRKASWTWRGAHAQTLRVLVEDLAAGGGLREAARRG
ncbi:hypothetical protein ACCO45_008404 [Purpureocillium lilacinum]|uniref:Uncharacterized protein n=1 Tax=Purpureocillium lilacinum TaxID=33203 RepID=A0ACC4DN71_PURLI